MAREVTKTQIDRLGARLRKGDISEVDLRLLDLYRQSFSDAYEIVVGTIRKALALEPTGRSAKSTTSIIEKLRRESIRLTQIQDIAGCRLIVPDIAKQEAVTKSLVGLLERTTVVDRRHHPSHGYRAVHVIASCHDKMIEIQVRTALQHLWAELSEKLSDVVDPAIKYGGGEETFQTLLTTSSSLVANVEERETQLAADMQMPLVPNFWFPNEKKQQLINLQEQLDLHRQKVFQVLHDGVELMKKLKGKMNVISD